MNPLIAFLQAPDLPPVVPAAMVLAGLRVSQPTLSRLTRSAGDRVLRIGKARATRYALTRMIGRTGPCWPLYRIDPQGQPQALGQLHALARAMWCWSPDAATADATFLHGEFARGLYPGWPWFLDDLRPQGFLGRARARRLASLLDAPEDPRLWRDEDILLALLRDGDDAPGDLVVGEDALRRALAARWSPVHAINEAERASVYPERAEAALRGDAVGSSAAGEQPKFTATLTRGDGQWRAVIVKFSEPAGTPAARRWADLLHCEHLAAETLREGGLPAAETCCLHGAGRVFLESTRFDRTPVLGRRGLVSLASLDAAFYGYGTRSWWQFAAELTRDGWLRPEDATKLARTGWFGALIGNSDMHLGNASLHLADARPLALAPAYDMLPMRWRPASTGELRPAGQDWRPPLPLPHETDDWLAAAELALHFWRTVLAAPAAAVSDDFKPIAREAALRVSEASAQLGRPRER